MAMVERMDWPEFYGSDLVWGTCPSSHLPANVARHREPGGCADLRASTAEALTDQSIHPVVTECLNLAHTVNDKLDHFLHLLSRLTTIATDETRTVAVTLNPNGAIDDVWIQPGIKRLGADIISERLNEALQTAAAALENVKADVNADHSRELAALQARADYLNTLIDAGSLASVRATSAQNRDTRSPTQAPAVTVSDPGNTIAVTTCNRYVTTITVTAAALVEGSEAELAAKVVEVAGFSYARDQAASADRLVAEAVALGNNEVECRHYLHRIGSVPTHHDIDAAYAVHYLPGASQCAERAMSNV
jgi:hypothetical protein